MSKANQSYHKMAEEEGTTVAKGNHVVPPGVGVEELDGGKKKLVKECPQQLQDVLAKNGVTEVYDRLVQSIVSEKTRSVFGQWRDGEIVIVLEKFADEFAQHGMKVCLCKRSSGSGTFRWLEFIPVEDIDNYVPQFDVANLSGQVIKTVYTTLEFPNGVAVEKLSRCGKARKKLKEKMPVYVEEMMKEKDLMEEYNALIDDIIAADTGSWQTWDTNKVNEIANAHVPKFEAKGVEVFISHKEEYMCLMVNTEAIMRCFDGLNLSIERSNLTTTHNEVRTTNRISVS